MRLSEDDAKQRWCPHARRIKSVGQKGDGAAVAVGTYNRNKTCNCAASACMQWRWATPHDGPATRLGYCGLAGKPEFA